MIVNSMTRHPHSVDHNGIFDHTYSIAPGNELNIYCNINIVVFNFKEAL